MFAKSSYETPCDGPLHFFSPSLGLDANSGKVRVAKQVYRLGVNERIVMNRFSICSQRCFATSPLKSQTSGRSS